MATKKKADSAKASKTSSKFFLGAALGAVAGVLIAPKSGKQTRKDIKRSAKKAGKKVKTEGAKLVSQGKKTPKKS